MSVRSVLKLNLQQQVEMRLCHVYFRHCHVYAYYFILSKKIPLLEDLALTILAIAHWNYF